MSVVGVEFGNWGQASMARGTIALVSLVTGVLLSVICGFAQADEEKTQAAKYHAALQRRPEPGYLFDRFYNAWLDQSAIESLQDFLQKQVGRADTTSTSSCPCQRAVVQTDYL